MSAGNLVCHEVRMSWMCGWDGGKRNVDKVWWKQVNEDWVEHRT
jgi:hypothetical protein